MTVCNHTNYLRHNHIFLNLDDYEELFVFRGISRQEVSLMTDVEFQKTLDDFRKESRSRHDNIPDAGMTSQYRYVSAKPAHRYQQIAENFDDVDQARRRAIQNFVEEQEAHNSARRDRSKIHAEQDGEDGDACNDSQQREFDARNEEIHHANQAPMTDEDGQEGEEREGEVIRRYDSLPPEPAKGTTIAVHAKVRSQSAGGGCVFIRGGTNNYFLIFWFRRKSTVQRMCWMQTPFY
jgi:hypothetical protein